MTTGSFVQCHHWFDTTAEGVMQNMCNFKVKYTSLTFCSENTDIQIKQVLNTRNIPVFISLLAS